MRILYIHIYIHTAPVLIVVFVLYGRDLTRNPKYPGTAVVVAAVVYIYI